MRFSEEMTLKKKPKEKKTGVRSKGKSFINSKECMQRS